MPLLEPDLGSLFALLADAGLPTAGILGLDVLEGWSIDFRDDHPWQINGLATAWFSTPKLQIGDYAPAPFVVTSVSWSDPGRELSIGTPFLVRHRAVVNLADHTLTYERKPWEGRESRLGAEDWAWAATVEPGAGVRVTAVVAGSVLDRRGVGAGNLLRTVGGEPAGQPRSVLEWRRAWTALALGQFSP